jgi:hypothetical protein
MNKINLPLDILGIVSDFNMISEDDVKENMLDLLDELKFYFFLKQELKLDRSQIKNRIELIKYMKQFFSDYLIFIV